MTVEKVVFTDWGPTASPAWRYRCVITTDTHFGLADAGSYVAAEKLSRKDMTRVLDDDEEEDEGNYETI